MNKGKFIVFEGIDGSGKSTLSALLHKKLIEEFNNSYYTFEPTNSPIGSVIRNILNKRIKTDEQTIGALFLADRLDHLQNESNGILKYINNGTNVVSDRYYYSSYAYHVPHLDLDWLISANKMCADLLRPDIVFYIDISVEESLRRISTNRNFNDLYETESKISQAKQNYENAINREGKKDNVITVNGHPSIEKVFSEIWSRTQEILHSDRVTTANTWTKGGIGESISIHQG